MQEVIEQYGSALVAALVTVVLLAGMGIGPFGMMKSSGTEYDPGKGPKNENAANTVENVTKEEPPATGAGTLRTGKTYGADEMISSGAGSITLIGILKDGDDLTGDILFVSDGIQKVNFKKEGVYRVRYTAVGLSGGEKTRNIYISVKK